MKVLIVCALAAVAMAAVSQEFVDKLNTQQTSWVAGTEGRIAQMDKADFQRLLGFDRRGWMAKHPNLKHKTFSQKQVSDVPQEFDSRDNWPDCQSMKDIRDQSDCGSCWAFGAVEAMSDRECVFNHRNHSYSAEDMNSCSGAGSCDGGYPDGAYDYYASTGLVTEQCRAYSLPSCDHHSKNSSNPCPPDPYPTPSCTKKCTDKTLNWKTDKHASEEPYTVGGEDDIMAEISQNGPCETAFDVYADFEAYQGGVYSYDGSSDYLGGHAVKFVGWGVDNGQKYWLVANSWNVHWGEQGFFRIARGNNECGIENVIWCSKPVKA
jgi:cathepsin B